MQKDGLFIFVLPRPMTVSIPCRFYLPLFPICSLSLSHSLNLSRSQSHSLSRSLYVSPCRSLACSLTFFLAPPTPLSIYKFIYHFLSVYTALTISLLLPFSVSLFLIKNMPFFSLNKHIISRICFTHCSFLFFLFQLPV